MPLESNGLSLDLLSVSGSQIFTGVKKRQRYFVGTRVAHGILEGDR